MPSGGKTVAVKLMPKTIAGITSEAMVLMVYHFGSLQTVRYQMAL